jgi:hypothetical protein
MLPKAFPTTQLPALEEEKSERSPKPCTLSALERTRSTMVRRKRALSSFLDQVLGLWVFHLQRLGHFGRELLGIEYLVDGQDGAFG